jgi:hypothetical protein
MQFEAVAAAALTIDGEASGTAFSVAAAKAGMNERVNVAHSKSLDIGIIPSLSLWIPDR